MAELETLCVLLIDAVTAGAARILDLKLSGDIETRYKDGTELVTTADEVSDRVIRDVLQSRLAAIDPEIALHLEESGKTGAGNEKIVGADPLDGTNHFAAGGNLYSVQAHYVERGVPLCGVVFQL